jgi:hypothetical protein
MSGAQRLIFAWTAGVLASLLTFSLNPPECRGTAVPEPVPLEPARVADEQRDAIRTYLQVRYDAVVYEKGGPTLMGLAYLPGDGPLIEIEEATLRRLLPDTRFFKTQLATAQVEFPHVPALVSFRPGAAGRDDIRTSLSPEFESPSQKFLWQFLGIAAPTLQARREVALAIARLMAETTYRFSAHFCADPQLVAGRAELWSDTGSRHWRDVDVFSNWRGQVSRVAISNPVDRRVEVTVASF